jgi:microsomal epoxide hydrolase
MLAVRRDPKMLENPTPEEQKFIGELNRFLKEETGYQWIQGTRPQTLAYGLTDSPVGLAAWLVEKFYKWTDCRGDLDSYFGRDTMITDIMLYWITGAIGSSFWPYYARMHGPWPIPEGETVKVPTAYIDFPKEILRPPRSVAEYMYTNIQRWTTHERGGHFAALEQPAVLAEDVRAFFRALK